MKKHYYVNYSLLSRIDIISKEIEYREKEYSDTIGEYSYWSKITSEHPGYRDGYYMLARKAYMLFNFKQSVIEVNKSLAIDPLFEKGQSILHELESMSK